MTWISGIRRRLGLLFRRRAAENRMQEEIRLHLDLETDRLARTGLGHDEARRQALVAFGGVERYKEELREGRGASWLSGLRLDLTLGWRMFLKYPGLSAVGVTGMAVAVAIGTVSFGVLYTFAGTSVPLDDGDGIVAIQNVSARQSEAARTHLHDLDTWRESADALGQIGAYRSLGRNLITQDGPPEPVEVAEMTASGFRIARVAPLIGRYFNDDDEAPGAPQVVVIGESVWQNRFAGQPDIVGRTIQLGAIPHTVIGVMPSHFAFPVNHRFWTPLRLDPLDHERGKAPPIQVFGRLAAGASLGDAEAQLAVIGRRLSAAFPETHAEVRPRVLPYARSFLDSPEFAWVFHLAQFSISLILVVIGTNVAILVYARTATRTGEIAVRTALGASRRRVVAQLFAEALVLSGVASALGLVAGYFGLRKADSAIVALSGGQLPFWWEFGVSPGTIMYVAGMAVLGALVVGVVPALKATRRDVHLNLQQLGPGGSGMQLGRSWTFMIVAQVAIAVAMLPLALAGAGNWLQVRATGPGYPAAEYLAASVRVDREQAPAGGEGEEDAASLAAHRATIQGELVQRLEDEPGVVAIALATAIPGDEPYQRFEFDSASARAIPEAARRPGGAGYLGQMNRVAPTFFDAFNIPLFAGRIFEPGDMERAGRSGAGDDIPAIVNRAFVQEALGGADALGRRFRRTAGTGGFSPEAASRAPWFEIVGVVSDFPLRSNLQRRPEPRVYTPLVPGTINPVDVIVHVRGGPASEFSSRLRQVAVAVDPTVMVRQVRTLDSTLGAEQTLDRALIFAMVLVIGTILLLSSAGIYALMSFTVALRRREIGIRSALGAGPRRLIRSVLSRALGQIATGIAIGLLASFGLDTLLGGGWTGGRGVPMLAVVAALVAMVGLLAAAGPARRALRIPPTEALKAD